MVKHRTLHNERILALLEYDFVYFATASLIFFFFFFSNQVESTSTKMNKTRTNRTEREREKESKDGKLAFCVLKETALTEL